MDANQVLSGAVTVQPGDTLIVALAGHGTAENVQRVVEGFKANLPNTINVVVLDGVQALAVAKGGA